MSDLTRTTAKKIADLRARFILDERFEPLQARFRILLEKRLADIAAGRSADAHGIALAGASGTGKSCDGATDFAGKARTVTGLMR